MDYQYTYLIATLLMMGIWLFLYIWRKDVRKEMIVMSIIISLTALTVPFIYYGNWWKPINITHTTLGIEDFIWGFAFGGIVAAIYEEVFKRKLRAEKLSKIEYEIQTIRFAELVVTCTLLMFAGVYLFHLNSLQATLLAVIPGTAVIWIQRKDLIKESIATAIMTPLIMIPIFIIMEHISPGVIDQFYISNLVTNVRILYTPLHEIIFYIFVGAFVGPIYEYWQEARFVKLRQSSSKKNSGK